MSSLSSSLIRLVVFTLIFLLALRTNISTSKFLIRTTSEVPKLMPTLPRFEIIRESEKLEKEIPTRFFSLSNVPP
jgi:hypothetical protein